ncbi:MAG: hypothetical protein LUQ37_01700, partial [Methanoregulaceae archaeon]|nr:hypothetical protein [Methanoregulaceae archaeon]
MMKSFNVIIIGLLALAMLILPASAVKITGYGDDVVAFSTNGGGLRIFNIQYSGSSYCSMWLIDAEGNNLDLLVSESGPFSSNESATLPTGIYYLEIDASGSWSIDLSPDITVISPPISDTPLVLNGLGDDVKSFSASGTGLRVFTINHNGDSSFYLDLKDSQGKHIEYLASEYGPYSGKTSVQLGSANYYLDIDTSGPWSIEITPSVTEHALPSGSSIVLQGSGDDVKAFASTGTGIRIFTINHNGDSSFYLDLKDSEGEHIEYLASEYGPYSGKTS